MLSTETPCLWIIDDQENNRILMTDALEDAGFFQIQKFADAQQALHALTESLPTLVLLDVRMPGLDGISWLRLAKAQLGNLMPLVVVLTAQTDLETRMQALGAGATDFLTKPFDVDELKLRVINLVELAQHRRSDHHRLLSLKADVSERDTHIEYLLHTDPTTGLPNSLALKEYVDVHQPAALAVLALEDVDQWENRVGNIATEGALRILAQKMQSSSEHVFFAWRSHYWVLPIAQDNTTTLPLLLDTWPSLIRHDAIDFQFQVRAGIVNCEPHTPLQELIRRGRVSLQASREKMVCYEPAFDLRLKRQTELRVRLRSPEAAQWLKVYFQPKIRIRDGSCCGAEALMRWDDPELGLISPLEFIPLAEDSGAITMLTLYLAEQVGLVMQKLRDVWKSEPSFSIAINLAPQSTQDATFPEKLAACLSKHHLTPQQIGIEITESGVMRDPSSVIATLARLRKVGHSIAIDDFGTGHSGLGILRDLPCDIIKIDRCFVDGCDNDIRNRTLVESILGLATDFSLDVVAEGIERREEAEQLLQLGCGVAQGFLYSKPLPAEAFIRYILQSPEN